MEETLKQIVQWKPSNRAIELIDTLPEEIQEELRKETKKGNDIVFRTQVENHFRYKHMDPARSLMRRYTSIAGPVSCYEFKIWGKTIWLFGDIHDRLDEQDSLSIPFDVYLKEVIQKSDRFVDVFFEKLFTKEKWVNEWHLSFMKDLIDSFGVCLLLQKDSCPYKNARFHYADYRKFFFEQEGMKWLYDQYINGYEILDTLCQENTFEQFKQFLHRTYQLLDHLQDYGKIKKQLDHVPVEQRQILLKNLEFLLEKEKRMYYVKKLDWISEEKVCTTRVLLNMLGFLFDIFDFIMDYYLVGRMFRAFDPRKAKQAGHPRFCENIVVYAGDAHIDHYVKLFRKIGATEIYSYSQGSKKGYEQQRIPFVPITF